MPFLTKSWGSYKVGVAIIMGDKVLDFPVTYVYINMGFLESIPWGAGQAIKGEFVSIGFHGEIFLGAFQCLWDYNIPFFRASRD